MSTGTAVNEETVTNNISCKRNSFLTDVFQLFFYFVVCFSFPSPLSTFPPTRSRFDGLEKQTEAFSKEELFNTIGFDGVFYFFAPLKLLNPYQMFGKKCKKKIEKSISRRNDPLMAKKRVKKRFSSSMSRLVFHSSCLIVKLVYLLDPRRGVY